MEFLQNLFDPESASLPLFTGLVWLLQLCLVVQVFATGRPYWWVFVLFAAPAIGGIAYFIVEIAPGLRRRRGKGFWASVKPRKWRIRELRAIMEESETVDNRLALAEELFCRRQEEEALTLAQECLRGVFKDDANVLAEVARYQIELGRHAEALPLLQSIAAQGDRKLHCRRNLLLGAAHLGLGRFAEAEACFREAESRHIGEEARFGLACALEKTGRSAEALEIWRSIRTKFKKAGPAWRRSEKRWYRLACEKLKSAPGSS